jgi:hypothetical protein
VTQAKLLDSLREELRGWIPDEIEAPLPAPVPSPVPMVEQWQQQTRVEPEQIRRDYENAHRKK